MIVIIYLMFSFFLDGLISNYLSFSLNDISFLKTIYTLIALVVSYNYFKNKKKYIIILGVISILFDIRYTNTFILNPVIFLVICFVNGYLDEYYPYNLMTINIRCLISIMLYHVITFIILVLNNYNYYDINILLMIVCRSIIPTIIYTSVSYLILKKIDPKMIK